MIRLDDEPNPIFIGQPILFDTQKDIPLEDIHSETFQHNLQILKKSQFRLEGIGLAAPQIGWPARVMCLGIEKNNQRYSQLQNFPFQFWINPKIKASSPTTCWTWEGCLSVPNLRGWVERPSHVDVKGYDETGKHHQVRMIDFIARVFQHELDHLDGILFPMKISNIEFIVPTVSLNQQKEWIADWPTTHAKNTLPGLLSIER